MLPGNIRYDYGLGGGATMDTGCYAVHMLRHLAGAEPEVTRAEARLSTYEHQLRAFADCVNSGRPVLTSAADGVANMRVIDRIYEKAGLPLRGQIV